MKSSKRTPTGISHIILPIIILALIGGMVFFALAGKGGKSSDNNPLSKALSGCKGENKVAMTHQPMDMADVSSVAPMGLTAGAHVTPIDHLYFYPKAGPRDKYPVYAMADGYISNIQVRGVNVSNGEQRPPEYRLEMQHTCRTTSYFDLITKLDDSITSKAPDASTKGYNGKIAIKSGQIIGWIGEQSLDTAIYDQELTLSGFISPKMYEGEPWKVHTDDFFSYFDAAMKMPMLAKNARTVEPRAGKIDYDQPGKLIGNWFKQGTNGYAGPKNTQVGDSSGRGYWSGHLAIIPYAYDPGIIVISIGDPGDGQPRAFQVKGNAPDPATISASSGVIKYELAQQPASPGQPQQQAGASNAQVQGVILVQVQSGEKLKAQVFLGKTATEVTGFTSTATTFER